MKDLLLYKTEDGNFQVEVPLESETVWLTQKQMSELFNKDVRTINEHIQNVFKEKELTPEATIRKFRIIREEGKRKVSRDKVEVNGNRLVAIALLVAQSELSQKNTMIQLVISLIRESGS